MLHLDLLLFCLLWSLAVVQVGFSGPSFTASESLGSVSVCINIFGAILARSVTVSLSTQDDTAFCEFVFVLAVYCIAKALLPAMWLLYLREHDVMHVCQTH